MFETKRRMLALMLARGRVHGYALAKDLALNTSTVYQHLRELETEGYATSEKASRRRFYRITKRGEILLQALMHP